MAKSIYKVPIISRPFESKLFSFHSRVEADSDIKDLELVDKNQVKKCMDRLNDKLKRKAIINKDYKIAILTQDRQNKEKIKTGKILHLAGDSCLDNKNSLLA